MNIIKRAQSDGLTNLSALILKKLKNLIYRRVKTLMFELKLPLSNPPPVNKRYIFKVLEANQPLFYLSLYEIDNFKKKGGVCITLNIESKMVGYVWCFTHTHHVDGIGNVNLDSQKAIWVGPAFIHKNHRGLGYNKALLQEVANNFAGVNAEVLLTSINSENIPSIKSFESFGFVNTKCIESTYILGKLAIDNGMLK